jgi:hypothetical protein
MQNQSSGASAAPGCRDTFVYQQQGSGKLGYPVEYSSTTWTGNSAPVTMTMKVTELSFAALDAGLFEIPEGYREFSASQPAEAAAAAQAIRVAVAPVANQAPGASAYLSSMLNSSGVAATAIASPTIEAARAAGAEFLLTVETGAPRKKGGMFGKLAKSIGGEETKADYTLVEIASGAQRARNSVALRSGGMGAGAGMMLAAGVAGGAASAAGSPTGSAVANTMTHTVANQMMQSAYANPQAAADGLHERLLTSLCGGAGSGCDGGARGDVGGAIRNARPGAGGHDGHDSRQGRGVGRTDPRQLGRGGRAVPPGGSPLPQFERVENQPEGEECGVKAALARVGADDGPSDAGDGRDDGNGRGMQEGLAAETGDGDEHGEEQRGDSQHQRGLSEVVTARAAAKGVEALSDEENEGEEGQPQHTTDPQKPAQRSHAGNHANAPVMGEVRRNQQAV